MKKKLLAIVLVLTLCLGMAVSTTAVAVIGTTEVTWDFDAGTGTLTFHGSGEMEDFNVPCGEVLPWSAHRDATRSVVIEDGITSVGACSFYQFPNLSSVSMPGSVKRISWSAFEGCTSLRSVVIPEGVVSVGNWSFQSCINLTDVNIPSSLTEANFSSFGNTPWLAAMGDFPVINGTLLAYQGSSREILIPEGVTYLTVLKSDQAEQVVIPATVTKMESATFENCPSVTSFIVTEGNPQYLTQDGVIFSKDKTTLIAYPRGRAGSYVIPDGVTTIAPCAFSSCTGLTGVTIPDSVRTIGKLAFYGTGLSTLTVPGSVTSIGESAFAKCQQLTSVVLSSGVTSTGRYGFDGCVSLSSVILPDTLTKIDYCAFWGCTALKSIEIPDSVTSVGQYAFHTALDTPISGLTIHGTAGSRAESFAKENGIFFQADLVSAPKQPAVVPATGADGFIDVKAGDYFAGPVLWAVEKGITSGTSKTTFSPNQNCTKAQILTFLWRASGSPKPAGSNPFSDVRGGDYYADAAAWAYEKGMVSSGTFGGNVPCTRSMAVTYLWKLAGSPAASGSSFVDVPANAAYAQAVSWAVEKGITAGTSATTFSPDQTCTRGQIVTFLHRNFAEPGQGD